MKLEDLTREGRVKGIAAHRVAAVISFKQDYSRQPGHTRLRAALATRVFDRPLNDCHLVHIGRLSKLRGNEGGIDDGQGGAALTGYPAPPKRNWGKCMCLGSFLWRS